MSVYGKRAEALQREGYNCCQCLIGTLCEEFGMDRPTAFRFAGAFGSGIGCAGDMCGALTGGMMAIGLKCKSKQLPDQEYDGEIDRLAREYLERFKEANGGKTRCRDLLGADPYTAEGWVKIRKNDRHSNVCRPLIIKAAEIAAEVILEKKPEEA